jgi:uncharacterized metal-binding protein
VLLYACSGGANVAEMADRAARQLMREGRGAMFCLAGLGADIPNMVQQAKDADLNLVIDGCSIDCARKIFERHGLKNVQYIRVTDLGIEKKKGVPVTDAEMEKVLTKCREVLGCCA